MPLVKGPVSTVLSLVEGPVSPVLLCMLEVPVSTVLALVNITINGSASPVLHLVNRPI